MFTGIIESLGKVVSLKKEKKNLHITVSSTISKQLKIDQSISHNGVCLTVVKIDIKAKKHTVTAIHETLIKTNLGLLKTNELINLERCLKIGDRLDGHMVQGHVDTTAICKKMKDQNGSWLFTFKTPKKTPYITVEKGSVCINGVSLTIVDSKKQHFSVAIIPYTYEYTNFKTLKVGDSVNIEFDIVGKYITKMLSAQLHKEH